MAVAEATFSPRECRAHRRRAAGEVPRRKARTHILLVEDIWNAAHAGSGEGRRHDVSTHAEHDIGPEAVNDAERTPQRERDEQRERNVLPQRITVESAHPDSFELEPGGGYKPLLRTTLASHQEYGAIRLFSAERSRDRESRIQVPAGPAASDQKPHLILDCSATPNPTRAGRC